jgi:tetratricopeptide (TPR) repeat protein
MTVDRDDHDGRSHGLPPPVFRPWPGPAAWRSRSTPRFLRPAAAGAAARAVDTDGPHFSRFAAAVEAAEARPTRACAALPEPASAQAPPRRRLRRTLGRAGVHSVTLASSALALAVLLVAILDWHEGYDPAPDGERAAQPDDVLIEAPSAPDRYRLATAGAASGDEDILSVGSLLATYQPPAVALAGDAWLATVSGRGRQFPLGAAPAAAVPPEPALRGFGSGSKLGSAATVGRAAVAVTDDRHPLYELAYRLQRKGETASAIAAYQLAAEIDPQHAATFYNWGYLLQRRGDVDGARDKYREALRLAPEHAYAHYNLASLLQKAGDRKGAIEHYRAAIAAQPDFAWSYYNLGYLEQQQGHYREALASYRRAIEADPEQTLAYENIAVILRHHHP